MYGFDQIKGEILFHESELIQVCIGANEIILNFFPDSGRITIFDVEGFIDKNGFMFDQLSGSQKKISQIGKTVQRFTVLSNDTAALTMSDGTEILLKDDSAEFEAVTLQYAGRIIVV